MFFGALVSWASIHANPQAYRPLDSTRSDPRKQNAVWALRAAARAASFPRGAGRARAGEKGGALPPPGASPKPRDGEARSPLRLLRGGGGGGTLPPGRGEFGRGLFSSCVVVILACATCCTAHMRGLGAVLRCGGGLCLRDSLFEGGGQREGVPVVGEGVEISIRNLRR